MPFLLAILMAACANHRNEDPTITGIVPSVVTSLTSTSASMEGQNFFSNARIDLDNGSTTLIESSYTLRIGDTALGAEDVQIVSPQRIDLVIPAGLSSGLRQRLFSEQPRCGYL